jgi:hypothetical protein
MSFARTELACHSLRHKFQLHSIRGAAVESFFERRTGVNGSVRWRSRPYSSSLPWWVFWTIASAEDIRTFHPDLYRVWTDPRTLAVYPGTCVATFTSVRTDETSSAVRVYVRGKGSGGEACANIAIVHLHDALDHRTVIDGSTGTSMRLCSDLHPPPKCPSGL